MDLVSKLVPVTTNLKPTAHFIFEKMELHDGVASKKVVTAHTKSAIDPALALHCIDRGGSDEGDQAPRQMQCADRWRTKAPSTSAIW